MGDTAASSVPRESIANQLGSQLVRAAAGSMPREAAR